MPGIDPASPPVDRHGLAAGDRCARLGKLLAGTRGGGAARGSRRPTKP